MKKVIFLYNSLAIAEKIRKIKALLNEEISVETAISYPRQAQAIKEAEPDALCLFPYDPNFEKFGIGDKVCLRASDYAIDVGDVNAAAHLIHAIVGRKPSPLLIELMDPDYKLLNELMTTLMDMNYERANQGVREWVHVVDDDHCALPDKVVAQIIAGAEAEEESPVKIFERLVVDLYENTEKNVLEAEAQSIENTLIENLPVHMRVSTQAVKNFVRAHVKVLPPFQKYLDQEYKTVLVLDTGDMADGFVANRTNKNGMFDERSSLLWLARTQGCTKEQVEAAFKAGSEMRAQGKDSSPEFESAVGRNTFLRSLFYAAASMHSEGYAVALLATMSLDEILRVNRHRSNSGTVVHVVRGTPCRLFDFETGEVSTKIEWMTNVSVPAGKLGVALPDKSLKKSPVAYILGPADDEWRYHVTVAEMQTVTLNIELRREVSVVAKEERLDFRDIDEMFWVANEVMPFDGMTNFNRTIAGFHTDFGAGPNGENVYYVDVRVWGSFKWWGTGGFAKNLEAAKRDVERRVEELNEGVPEEHRYCVQKIEVLQDGLGEILG